MRGGLGAIVLSAMTATAVLAPSAASAQYDMCKTIVDPKKASENGDLQDKTLFLINQFRQKKYFGEVIQAGKGSLGEESYEFKYEAEYDGKAISAGIEIGFDQNGFIYLYTIFQDVVLQHFGVKDGNKDVPFRVGADGRWIPNTCHILSRDGPNTLDMFQGNYYDKPDRSPIASYSNYAPDNLPDFAHARNDSYKIPGGVVDLFIIGLLNQNPEDQLRFLVESYKSFKTALASPPTSAYPSLNAPQLSINGN